jgi:small multidrug resistance pump
MIMILEAILSAVESRSFCLMSLFIAIAAALVYTIGGVFMKLSQGLTVLGPTLMVYVCFLAGATLQILLLNGTELGVNYIFVLGMEAVLAALFGIYYFQEKLSLTHLSGMVLVVVGIALLRTGGK